LVGTRWPISVLFGINRLRNKPSNLVQPPFPVFRAGFSATTGWHLLGDLIENSLSGGLG